MEDSLASDFVAVWQSELTAMAADRELRETWTAMLALWATAANMALTSLPPAHDTPPGSAGAAQPAGPAPVSAASGSSLAAIEHLSRRVTELEQNLAAYLANQPG